MIQLALDLAQKTCHLAQKLLFPRKYVVPAIVAGLGSRSELSLSNRLPAVADRGGGGFTCKIFGVEPVILPD